MEIQKEQNRHHSQCKGRAFSEEAGYSSSLLFSSLLRSPSLRVRMKLVNPNSCRVGREKKKTDLNS